MSEGTFASLRFLPAAKDTVRQDGPWLARIAIEHELVQRRGKVLFYTVVWNDLGKLYFHLVANDGRQSTFDELSAFVHSVGSALGVEVEHMIDGPRERVRRHR